MGRERTPLQKQEQRELEKIEICMDIFQQTKQELYLSMRFFDVALNRMEILPDMGMDGVGMDGLVIRFHPDAVIAAYKDRRVRVNRLYLHMIFHCLFLHFQIPEGIRDEEWNLACDIVAESLLDSVNARCVRVYVPPVRKNLYQKLAEKYRVLTAKNVYQYLVEMELPEEELRELQREFCADSHRLWKNEMRPEAFMERERQWKADREKMQTEMETFGKEISEDVKTVLEQIRAENRRKYDYRKFLRKFVVLKEETGVDMDSFDYIFYHYGMEHYGNMPLIEPQETREVQRIEDFVIAIDTSMSCKGELVKRFLEETFGVLSESESYFRKINIHIIQCDDRIQSDILVTNQEEMKACMEQFEIRGQGGTDFRPVFAYVDKLLQKGAFHRLRGLLYFTDGYGTYPAKRPLYDTAFIFMKEDYQDVDVPVWAMKIILDPEDLERKAEVSWT